NRQQCDELNDTFREAGALPEIDADVLRLRTAGEKQCDRKSARKRASKAKLLRARYAHEGDFPSGFKRLAISSSRLANTSAPDLDSGAASFAGADACACTDGVGAIT